MKKFVMAAVAVALSSGSAYAATANGSATAEVVAPITLTHTTGATINFGMFVAGTGGSVIVTPLGVGSSTGGVTLVAGSHLPAMPSPLAAVPSVDTRSRLLLAP